MKSSSDRGKGNPGNPQGGSEEEWARFGLRVRELREAVGLSVGDLSTREIREGSTVQRIEKGDTDVPLYLAEYLDRRLKAQGSLVNAWARTKPDIHLATGGRPHDRSRPPPCARARWPTTPGSPTVSSTGSSRSG
ncbi:helix-turn-helix domain-containing protein [Nocardiopsis alba]|uniref:helix-turn-helix domain-containing protein n=1 Tax=Nocardiopsis alba TaxID=53437 RepID=UPI001926D2EA|nr:helix-turn-helix transcriptional regulator [Nocardiopsis alba]